MTVLTVRVGLVEPVAADIYLAANDGLDASVLHGGIEVDAAVHDTVVSDGAGGHAERFYPFNKPGDSARAVQQAVFCM